MSLSLKDGFLILEDISFPTMVDEGEDIPVSARLKNILPTVPRIDPDSCGPLTTQAGYRAGVEVKVANQVYRYERCVRSAQENVINIPSPRSGLYEIQVRLTTPKTGDKTQWQTAGEVQVQDRRNMSASNKSCATDTVGNGGGGGGGGGDRPPAKDEVSIRVDGVETSVQQGTLNFQVLNTSDRRIAVTVAVGTRSSRGQETLDNRRAQSIVVPSNGTQRSQARFNFNNQQDMNILLCAEIFSAEYQ